MNLKHFFFIVAAFMLISGLGNTKQKPFPVLKGPYLGQKSPGKTPVIFAPGIVSTDVSEFSCTFSPDGAVFYFARDRGGYKYNIYFTKEDDHGWIAPKVASFSGEHMDHEPYFSHSGRRLYWGSMRPLKGGKKGYATWYIEKNDGNWGKPQPLGFFAMYVTSSRNKTLYFTTRKDGKVCIAKSRYVNDQYQEPEFLNPPVFSEYWDAHPFIAPDESYLIFDSENRPKEGKCRLWICFQKKDGNWTEPKNMGSHIPQKAGYAMLSPDGKYLFFSAGGDIYWVDSKIIEEFKPNAL